MSREEEPMSRALWWGCLVVVALLGGANLATSQEKLEWKAFDKAGAKFYQEMTTETNQTMKVMGMEVKQTQSQTFYMEWNPEKSDKDSWTVEQKIIGVKMNINIGGNNIPYNSQDKDQPANPLTDFFAALKDAKFTLTISKKDDDKEFMKITKIDGRKEFIDKLVKTNMQLDALLKQILSEDALKQMADPTFAAIPTTKALRDKGVKKGDSWENTSKLDMGPIGTYITKSKYTVEDVDKKTAKIGVITSLDYEAPTAKSGALPFEITKGKLTGKDGKGTIVFNIEKGYIESSEMNLTLNGTLTITIAGQPTEVTLDQTQTSKLKTFEKNPLETK
jgi:hypothetical protein